LSPARPAKVTASKWRGWPELPAAVIERAKNVLRQHEKQERQSVQVETEPDPMQMTIFTPLSQRIVDRIDATDVNALTPLQALNLLEELQQELKKNRD